jgi:hypothetical protein
VLGFGGNLEKRGLRRSTVQSPVIEGLDTYYVSRGARLYKKEKRGRLPNGRSRFRKRIATLKTILLVNFLKCFLFKNILK